MKAEDRKLLRRRLDVEMRPFRRAAVDKDATQGLLRAVRLALRIPRGRLRRRWDTAGERFLYGSAGAGGDDRDAGDVRAAEAMGCMVVYGIVPGDGLTLEALYERRLWADVLGVPELNSREYEGMVREIMDGDGI